jgi:hypothetical protein
VHRHGAGDATARGWPYSKGARPEQGIQVAAAKRTTHRSSKGTKLYAVRDAKGRFKDIQTYKRAHTADMRRKSKAEKKAAK